VGKDHKKLPSVKKAKDGHGRDEAKGGGKRRGGLKKKRGGKIPRRGSTALGLGGG